MLARLQELAEKNDPHSQRMLAFRLVDMFIDTDTPTSEAEKSNFAFIIDRVVEKMTAEEVCRISERLAHTTNISEETAVKFAEEDDIRIAGPMLRSSPVLSDNTLIRVVTTKSEDHRVAIAERKSISYAVTEALTEHGGEPTLETVSRNPGARFNPAAMHNLLSRAVDNAKVRDNLETRVKKEDGLAETIRTSLNAQLREKLGEAGYSEVTNAVDRLNEMANEEVKRQIREDRMAQVDAMVARAKIDSGQATLDAMVAEALQRKNFTSALRIIGLTFGIGFDYIINAVKREDHIAMALLAKASDLDPDTYLSLETARCEHFDHELNDIAAKLKEAASVKSSDAEALLDTIKQNIADHEAAAEQETA